MGWPDSKLVRMSALGGRRRSDAVRVSPFSDRGRWTRRLDLPYRLHPKSVSLVDVRASVLRLLSTVIPVFKLASS